MKETIKKQTIALQKVTDQLGKIHVFKMIPRAEREFCIQAIAAETGALLTPAIMVTGELYDGKAAWNLGKKVAKFYDPDKERGFNIWKTYPDVVKAIEDKHKGVIYLRGEWKKKIAVDKETGEDKIETSFKTYGYEISNDTPQQVNKLIEDRDLIIKY